MSTEQLEQMAKELVMKWHREVGHFYDLCESDSPLIKAIVCVIEKAVEEERIEGESVTSRLLDQQVKKIEDLQDEVDRLNVKLSKQSDNFVERVRSMSSEERVAFMVSAGINTADGKLTERYRE